MDQGSGIRIVEDRGIVAGKIRRELERAGFGVAGMAATRAAGIDLAGRLPLAGAILDVDLRGEPVYQVAGVLHQALRAALTGQHAPSAEDRITTPPSVSFGTGCAIPATS